MDLSTSLREVTTNVTREYDAFFLHEYTKAVAIHPSVGQSVKLLHDFSLRGGKAIRAYLAFLGYSIAQGEDHPGLYKAVGSVDLHHKHILILDDISDRDERRYGGPTIEYSYRTIMDGFPDRDHKARSFAMLDGVLLGALSKELLLSSKFAPHLLLDCIHLFNTVLYEDTLAGWQIHGLQCAHPIKEATIEEFVKGLELVTARYTFEGPLRIGLTLAKNTDKELENSLRKYANLVGTAFQMHDDYLGLFGDSEKTGKPVGNDVREGKKTILIQTAYQRASETERDFLESVTGKDAITQEEIHSVQGIVEKTGALAHSRETAIQYVENGIKALETLPDSNEKQLLIDLAHYIITREK